MKRRFDFLKAFSKFNIFEIKNPVRRPPLIDQKIDQKGEDLSSEYL